MPPVFAVSDVQSGAKSDGTELNWPGNVRLSSQAEGNRVRITLDIRSHDYRLLKIAGSRQ